MNKIVLLYNNMRKNKLFSQTVVPAYRTTRSLVRIPKEIKRYKRVTNQLQNRKPGEKRIFYLGSPLHANLGDLAQGVCIRRWFAKHFPDYTVVEIKTNAIVNTHFSIIDVLKKNYLADDIIVFQSGYATTDIGGYADDMHCAVIQALPNAKMLMMPQTILFESEERKRRTSRIYNSAPNMLFLARDRVSYNYAEEMFPDIQVMAYPDIVTTLIGGRVFDGKREGIMFCCRDDSEKYYSDKELDVLMQRCREFAEVSRTDTTKYSSTADIIENPEKYVIGEIEKYAKYKVIVTDRYHGTIFSLVAATPVVIIKSTDHKVTTGADWFKGIYDDNVFVAESLDQAYDFAKKLYERENFLPLASYFEETYYDKLPDLFMSGDNRLERRN